jgi:hypothetical protein
VLFSNPPVAGITNWCAGDADVRCPLLGEVRKAFAHSEFFSV